jgi:hypothetical protein
VMLTLPAVTVALSLLVPGEPPAGSTLTGLPLLYISPDQILPVTSILSGALGVVLMFWNRLIGFFRRSKKPSQPS